MKAIHLSIDQKVCWPAKWPIKMAQLETQFNGDARLRTFERIFGLDTQPVYGLHINSNVAT